MLDRIKKNLIISAIGLALTMPAFAVDSTISYISINNMAYQDVEIVLTEKNEILVPFKQLADIFNIQYNANRVDKIIAFKTLDGKDGVVSQKGVFINDYAISNRPTTFVQQGIMDGVFNEAYITAETASKIFGAKIETDFNDLTIIANVERDIPILHSSNLITAEDKGPKAHQDVVCPKKQGKITLSFQTSI
ncbi:hypothetical protein EGQ24_03240, partial [bacterium]|nr:hypothetical protein [bacterium]